MIDNSQPTILVYRRTHAGDPDGRGLFGCHNCMKSVRGWQYDAVVGIGGASPDPGYENIAYKVNWIGIGPEKLRLQGFDNPLVIFKHYLSLDSNGPHVQDIAPRLYKYMFVEGHITRTAKSYPEDIYRELQKILALASDAPPSPGDISECIPKGRRKSCRSKTGKHSTGGCR